MSLFDPAALPELLVEAIRPLVNKRNVVASEDYEPDPRSLRRLLGAIPK